jgi:4a-hydroxytetrahydrobiopterin dehydratase
MALADHSCVPCRGGVPPLGAERATTLLEELAGGWNLNQAGHLERAYTFANFRDALAFADDVGALAEAENHHPDLHVAWGRCVVELWTHKISGLTESDFYLAAKITRLEERRSQR